MTEPLFTPPPVLTPRQQAAYDLIASRDGVTAEQLGAHLHAGRDRHPEPDPCEWCHSEGLSVIRSKALHPHVTYKRTPDGNQYILRDRAAGTAAVPDGSQMADLPGETWEDLFGATA